MHASLYGFKGSDNVTTCRSWTNVTGIPLHEQIALFTRIFFNNGKGGYTGRRGRIGRDNPTKIANRDVRLTLSVAVGLEPEATKKVYQSLCHDVRRGQDEYRHQVATFFSGKRVLTI